MTVAVTGLGFSYGSTPILVGASLTVRPGRVIALFGPNGTGKSTLFRCILGLLPHTGEIEIDGRATAGWSARRTARHLAFVPQDHRAAFPHSVRDMVTMGTTSRGASLLGPTASDVEHALGSLDRLGLVELADREFSSLSGGQRQLVLIARALAQDTPYVLFDEPTASLDFGNQNLIWTTLRELAHEHGKGILVCSHDPNHVLWFADDAVVLGRDGRVGAPGPVGEIVTERTLRELYEDDARVTSAAGTPVVLPGTVATGNGATPHFS